MKRVRLARSMCAGVLCVASVTACSAHAAPDAASAIVVTAFVAVLAVMIHYEALAQIARLLTRSGRTHRVRLAGLVLAILTVHLVEIGLFGLACVVLAGGTLGSGLEGAPVTTWLDYFYYSGVVYTTLGFGDLVPTDGLRLLTTVESVTGLVLITWSASLMFLEMRRIWEER